jgi:NO-binding membrane sensor protein with MHYT domain
MLLDCLVVGGNEFWRARLVSLSLVMACLLGFAAFLRRGAMTAQSRRLFEYATACHLKLRLWRSIVPVVFDWLRRAMSESEGKAENICSG